MPLRNSLARRGLVLVLAPLLVGAGVFVSASAYPADSVVGGTIETGPRPPAVSLPPDGLVMRAYRDRTDRTLTLSVTPQLQCSVRVAEVTSTAPGRIDVRLVSAPPCDSQHRTVLFRLPEPTVLAKGQPVRIGVGLRSFRVTTPTS